MGIYDRDYVRRDGPSFLGSFTKRGQVCKWLVGINVVVFIIQVLTRPDDFELGWFTDAFALDVQRVLHGQIWRLLTYAFLHDPGTIWHILINMLFLWWFGSDVEDLCGPHEFLAFYLSAALAAGLLFLFSSLLWMPRLPALSCLGASGGVIAVLTLCAIYYPRRRVLLFFVLPAPLPLFLVIFLAGDAYVLFLNKYESSTAVAAHLGGALFAGVYHLLHIRLLDWLPPLWDQRYLRGLWQNWRRRLFGPRLRLYVDENAREKWNAAKPRPSAATAESIYHPEPKGQPLVSAPVADEHLEAKMDAILEKISRVGKENLTESEREFLLRASEIFRRRRT